MRPALTFVSAAKVMDTEALIGTEEKAAGLGLIDRDLPDFNVPLKMLLRQ